jgi:hypothetical protein
MAECEPGAIEADDARAAATKHFDLGTNAEAEFLKAMNVFIAAQQLVDASGAAGWK